ncbi:dihydroxyacetone kinase subunit L [Alginatibacterium sediminis]|uniref:Dihydroxyacetone kinase subunit L n=1 Tax=Alginatibacterium sediminis TaxID=2164068 RepID=A0A420E6B5_9ALTE|nr:dihydroxyacetone kinase subunit DhaL [Alginatibacterium sediminis]RKF13161.1 dihydroxyacetone kinase subunit L [Alginatibacterium sediminis]
MTIEKSQILNWLNSCADIFAKERDYLTQLDADIGDADHGINMNRGFERVKDKITTIEDQDIGTIFKTTGMTLLSSVGGASGPLYGTFFIRAAAAGNGKQSIDLNDLCQIFSDGVDGVVARGKAQPGDKTMCDVWWTVVEALEKSKDEGQDLQQALVAMGEASEKGAAATIEMQAKKGRASYLGERSIGHQDPGATSSMMMVKALRDVVVGQA